jgi:hypothetical protein
MIIFFGEGGLGNQIFQYAFIKNFLKEKEILITCNFSKLLEQFDIQENIKNVDNRYLRYLCNKIAVPVLKILSLLRIISYVKAERGFKNGFPIELNSFISRRGLFSPLFIFPGYFQSEQMFDQKNLFDLKIKDKYKKEAEIFMKNRGKKKKKIFVHIRRGDYKNEIVFGEKDISLPLKYYKNSISSFYDKGNPPLFIFMSNDLDFVEENFRDIKDKVISKEIDHVDFAIMTLCDGGIMSNSTFSWWGAYFCRNNKNLLAPRYWLGFKSKTELPIGVTPSFVKLVEV